MNIGISYIRHYMPFAKGVSMKQNEIYIILTKY
jgi:hypothetical protein